jgi:hypothetical protein
MEMPFSFYGGFFIYIVKGWTVFLFFKRQFGLHALKSRRCNLRTPEIISVENN